ncbi:MAG: Sulfoxide reductase heme-binding subunit YedZ [Gemmatimonadaceae bacterium]|nr:Sulfoxide reductase heme-binding subunit YedZ [Gemmatimonadaceae bacterium]
MGSNRDWQRSVVSRLKSSRQLPRVLFVLALAPLMWGAGLLASDLVQGTRYLGSNPIKELEHFTGKWTLRFLILSLTVTPLMALTHQGWLIRYRRTWGLFAFFYACVHLTIYFVLDVELNWADFGADILKRKYIAIGMTALSLMIPLVLTSTKASIRRMGNIRWTALHRLVFATVILANIHYWMSVKRDIREPLLFALIFGVLLGYRLRAWWRERAKRPGAGSAALAKAPTA